MICLNIGGVVILKNENLASQNLCCGKAFPMTTFYFKGRLHAESVSELRTCLYCGNLLSDHSERQLSPMPITEIQKTKLDGAELLTTTQGFTQLTTSSTKLSASGNGWRPQEVSSKLHSGMSPPPG